MNDVQLKNPAEQGNITHFLALPDGGSVQVTVKWEKAVAPPYGNSWAAKYLIKRFAMKFAKKALSVEFK